jgi:hypothetical protein
VFGRIGSRLICQNFELSLLILSCFEFNVKLALKIDS